jgi:hypothetical protein
VDGRCESLFHDSLFPCAELHVGASVGAADAAMPMRRFVMRMPRRYRPDLALAILGCVISASSASAVNYNFNNGPEGWYAENYNTGTSSWVHDPSPTAGYWTVDGELPPSGQVSANYVYSPILCVTKDTVTIEVLHRFNFATFTGTSGTVPTGLGQLQYRVISSGSGFQASPISYTNIVPTYSVTAPPPFPLEVGLAWEGTSPEFGLNPAAWKNTKGDIPLLEGDVFQVRFVNTHLGPYDSSYNPNPAWQIDEVRFTNVTECVPEPGTLALLGIGGGLIVLARLRRTPRGRALGHSTVMGIVVAVAVVAAALAIPPAVKADVLFDFQVNQNGNVPGVTWTESQQGNVAASKRWIYYPTGDKRWGVLAAGADSITSAKAAHLTSSTFSGIVDGGPAQNARISLAHNFFLPPSGTGGPRPISLGQLQYQINNSGTWVGLPLDAFTSGGDLNIDDPVFGPSPFKNPAFPIVTTPLYVDQTAFVPPTYVTSTTAPLIPYVAPGGASFVGQTTGWSSLYVPSQAFLNINTGLAPEGITSMQLRLTNASLGGNCINNEGWNVRMLAVEFDSVQPPVPEPATLALALAGGGAACAARALRRRRSPAALEAE